MSGTAIVTIGGNQWSVEVATTTSELINGLSGRASLVAGTGMLFVLPVRQVITVQTNQMLFPLDIIFIKDNIVLDVIQNVGPGLLVEEATPCDGFLEINAGEADLVEVGDTVTVEITTPPASGFDWSSITSFAIPLAVLGFVIGMVSGGSSKKELPPGLRPMTPTQRKELVSMYGEDIVKQVEKELAGKGYGAQAIKCEELYSTRGSSGKELSSGHHSNPGGTEVYVEKLPMCDFGCGRQALYDGRTHQGPWANMCEEHFEQYGVGLGTGKGQKLLLRSKVLGEAEKIREKPEKELSVTMKEKDLEESVEEGLWYPKCPYCGVKTSAEPDAEAVYCSSCNKRFKIINPFFSSRYHHSIHGEPRQRLVEKYGSWAVGRAEAVCPENDIAAVEKEAKRLSEVYRSRYSEEGMEYLTIISPGQTVFHYGDIVSRVALEKEQKRVRALGENEAMYQ